MQVSAWVPVGSFVVAAAGLMITAIGVPVAKYLKRRFRNLKVEISFPLPDCLHIVEVCGDGERIRVVRLGIWTEIVVTNLDVDPRLVNQIRAYECESPPRDAIAAVSWAHFSDGVLTIGDPLTYPLRVEARGSLRIWTIVEIDVPQSLGDALGNLYGIKGIVLGANSRRKLEQFRGREIHFREESRKTAENLGLTLKEFTMGPMNIRNPVVRLERDRTASVNQSLSRLPAAMYLDLVQEIASGSLTYRDIENTPFSSYVIEVCLQGRSAFRRIGTIHNALWFLHPDNAFSE